MKRSDEATRARVAGEVLEYLEQHPDAQDTLEGVCDWWLLERRIRRTVREVEAALGELVAKGFVAARRGNDGKTHYGLIWQQKQRIHAHLRERRRLRTEPTPTASPEPDHRKAR